jgi:hypothetical protein
LSSFITTDATQSVFELVLARPVVTPAGEHPWLVNLWWRASQQGDRLVQVYIQGGLYDVTLDPSVREMCLLVDRTHTNRIELLAVPADDAQEVWRPQPGLLASWDPGVSSTAQVVLVRDESLAVDTQLVISVDGTNTDHGAMWPNDEPRSGFGALLGAGCFGYDDATGPGLGIGELGAGPLGLDGTALRWRRDDLGVGSHDIQVNAVNHSGLPVAVPLLIQDTLIDNLPDPVSGLSIDPSFLLSWTLTNPNS